MNSHKGDKNNLLILRAIKRMYPASFACGLTISIHFMTDSILAGFFFTPTHIAAIGIGMPAQMLLNAIVGIFGSGMMLKMASCIGRGDGEGAQKTYSLGMFSQLALSILFTLFILLFAEPMVRLCGAREDTVALASKYVRFYSPFMICGAMAGSGDRLLSLYGHPDASFKMACIKMVGNLVFSVLLVKFTDLGIAGLGLGSVIAEAISVFATFAIIQKKKLELKLKVVSFKFRELLEIIRMGLPSSCDMLIESFVNGIVNNILVSALGTIALSIYAVTNGIVHFANIASQAAAQTASPLFGLLFGARDRSGIKRSFRDGYLLGVIATAAWGAVILLAMPLLLKFYGMAAPDMAAIIRPGVYIGIAMIAVNTLNRMTTAFFEATDRFVLALGFSVIPDSVFFPLVLPFMLSAWGYTGLWLCKGLCILAFFLMYILAVGAWTRKMPPAMGSLMQLNADLRDHAPKMDISIHSDNASAQGISERIHTFLADNGASKRTAYMAALCVEELAVDFIEHMRLDRKVQGEVMDIKLFVDEGCVTTILRNDAPPYNPLDFVMDDTYAKMGVAMAQKVAKKVEYNYMYKMNVVTIVLGG